MNISFFKLKIKADRFGNHCTKQHCLYVTGAVIGSLVVRKVFFCFFLILLKFHFLCDFFSFALNKFVIFGGAQMSVQT